MFLDIKSSSVSEMQAQIGALEAHETVEPDEPVTRFLAWCIFVVHYKRKPMRKKWLLLNWIQAQCGCVHANRG